MCFQMKDSIQKLQDEILNLRSELKDCSQKYFILKSIQVKTQSKQQPLINSTSSISYSSNIVSSRVSMSSSNNFISNNDITLVDSTAMLDNSASSPPQASRHQSFSERVAAIMQASRVPISISTIGNGYDDFSHGRW